MKEPSWPRLRAELEMHDLAPDDLGKYRIADLQCFPYHSPQEYPHICADAAIIALRADGLLKP